MKRTDTKQLIIDTAAQLFYQKGYNLTGINEIIATAGIAKATLYSHFKSKEALCVAYLAAKDEAFLKDIQVHCSQKQQGNEQLIGVLDFLIPFFNSEEFNGCWCIRTVAEIPQENEVIRTAIRKSKQTLLQFIRELVTKNKPTLSERVQYKLAHQIYLLYESAVAESHLHGEEWPIHENIDMLKGILE